LVKARSTPRGAYAVVAQVGRDKPRQVRALDAGVRMPLSLTEDL
jgi:hypothetical protein